MVFVSQPPGAVGNTPPPLAPPFALVAWGGFFTGVVGNGQRCNPGRLPW